MPALYVFELAYLTPEQKDGKIHEVQEFIVAETLEQAMAYWRTEFIDEATDIILLRKSVPIVAICPAAILTRYGYQKVDQRPESA